MRKRGVDFARGVVFASVLFHGCASCASSQQPTQQPAPTPVRFLFGMAGDASGAENFVAVTSVPAVIAKARAELALSPASRTLHISGTIAAGGGGDNLNWHWHFKPDEWDLVEASVELCDGRPSDVEKNLDYWLNTVGRFCPWSSRVLAELKE